VEFAAQGTQRARLNLNQAAHIVDRIYAKSLDYHFRPPITTGRVSLLQGTMEAGFHELRVYC
jgi:hypothetical protein